MTDAEPLRWQAAIGAALARAGARLRIASLAIGVAGVALAMQGHSGVMAFLLTGAQALLTAAGLYLGFRLDIDAELFAQLAQRPDLAGFDAAMDALGLLPPAKQGRPIAARLAGVKRLLALQGAGLAAQLALLLALPAM